MTAALKRTPPPTHIGLFDNIDEERLERIWTPFWLNYPEGTRALEYLARLLKQPKSHRPQSCLIIADPAAGKTALAKQFVKTVNPEFTGKGEGRTMPVVYVQAPPNGNAALLYTAILESIGAPHRPTWLMNRKIFELQNLLPKLGTRMLIVDELHHILAGTVRDRSVFLNVLKSLSSEFGIPIVGIGTKELLRAMHTDEQFASRFEPYRLKQWNADEDYARFLVQLCRHAGFKDTSAVKQKGFVRTIHRQSKGLTGEAWKLMSRLLEYAETQGSDKLDIGMLEKIGWVMPGERRWMASQKPERHA